MLGKRSRRDARSQQWRIAVVGLFTGDSGLVDLGFPAMEGPFVVPVSETSLTRRDALRTRGGWFPRTPTGRKGPYRFVVLNAPARAGRELLRPLPAFADVTALLDAYRYFDSRLVVHTDPASMHRDRRNWGAYNAV